LAFTFSRSSGPGGQNVNKLNTRVGVSLDVANCSCLTDAQRQKIIHALKGRMDKRGVLWVICQEYRSQHANRKAVLERLAELIADALKPVKKRKKTKIPKAVIEKRLREKKNRSLLKKRRSEKPIDD